MQIYLSLRKFLLYAGLGVRSLSHEEQEAGPSSWSPGFVGSEFQLRLYLSLTSGLRSLLSQSLFPYRTVMAIYWAVEWLKR